MDPKWTETIIVPGRYVHGGFSTLFIIWFYNCLFFFFFFFTESLRSSNYFRADLLTLRKALFNYAGFFRKISKLEKIHFVSLLLLRFTARYYLIMDYLTYPLHSTSMLHSSHSSIYLPLYSFDR